MKVYAFEASDWAEAEGHGLSKELAVHTLEGGLEKVTELLPHLSTELNIAVRPHSRGIIPEYGTGAITHDSEFIEVWIDKTVPFGVEKMLQSLYQTVFHEGCHAARWNIASLGYDDRAIAGAVFEGLATVLEREYAGHEPLYGVYEEDATMQHWFSELEAAGTIQDSDNLFFNHPDGRRWIGYKTGAWIVDSAVRRSGKRVEQLIDLPADEIIKIADIKGRA